ncbi:MAG: hypothetical protein ACK5O7_06975 [Holosporales bacterium]
MKKRIYFILMSSVLGPTSIFASEIEKENTTEISSRRPSSQHPALEEQLARVKDVIDHADTPVKLILGAWNEQSNQERFQDGATWIFLDQSEPLQNPNGKPYLTASFNDLATLQHMAKVLGPSFDEIRLDRATFHMTQWSLQHLSLFADMLKRITGEFVLTSYFQTVGYNYEDTQVDPIQDILRYMAEKNKPYLDRAKEELPNRIDYSPMIEANEEDKHDKEVTDYLCSLAPLFAEFEKNPQMNKKYFHQKAQELGLKAYPSKSMVKEGIEVIRDARASKIKERKVIEIFFNRHILPAIANVFEELFEKVTLEGITSEGLDQTTTAPVLRARAPLGRDAGKK